jgi:salicylate hydroxylase
VADVKVTSPNSRVHRKRLLEALVAFLPPNVKTHFSTRVLSVQNVAADVSGNNAYVTLEIAPARVNHKWADTHDVDHQETTTFKADAVIGADGIKSTTRSQTFSDAHLRWMNVYSYRALLPIDRVKELDPDWAVEACMWIGPGKVLFSLLSFGV